MPTGVFAHPPRDCLLARKIESCLVDITRQVGKSSEHLPSEDIMFACSAYTRAESPLVAVRFFWMQIATWKHGRARATQTLIDMTCEASGAQLSEHCFEALLLRPKFSALVPAACRLRAPIHQQNTGPPNMLTECDLSYEMVHAADDECAVVTRVSIAVLSHKDTADPISACDVVTLGLRDMEKKPLVGEIANPEAVPNAIKKRRTGDLISGMLSIGRAQVHPSRTAAPWAAAEAARGIRRQCASRASTSRSSTR